jgi:sugar lactone lactonase YvrE
MTDVDVLLTDLAFPESPRWHDGRIHVSDWGAGVVHAVSADGTSAVVARGSAFPLCFDFLPDGRLLLVNGSTLEAHAAGGTTTTYADLGHLSKHTYNDITVDGHGNVFVNNIDFDYGSEPEPGFVAVVTPDGAVRKAADELMFPNGMAVLGDVLVVAESYAGRLTAYDVAADGSLTGRRTWADLGDDAPDGICVDPDGRIWYASVPGRACSLVAEGGEVLRTIDFDRGAFSCALRDGVLYVALNIFGEEEQPAPSGQLVAVTL